MPEVIARYDVVILGGGPAGAAAAIELARHGRGVLVLERSRYENARIGETLPPQAMQWFQQLGISNVIEAVPHRVAPGLVIQWAEHTPTAEPFRFHSYGHGWHLDRARFDAALAEAAEQAGAVVRRGAVVRSCERSNDDGWRVLVDIDGGRKEIDARWLIDATGRKGWFIRRQGVRPQVMDRLIGLLGYLGPRASTDQRLFVEARPDGWWYSSPLPGERSIAAFMTDRDLIPNGKGALPRFWEEQRGGSKLISCLHGKMSEGDPLRIVAANGSWSRTVTGHGWLAIGDTAMAHDPLFGIGIFQALATGLNAARALLSSFNGDIAAIARYQGWTESSYRDYLARHARVYSSVARWSDSRFWNRRARTANAGRAPD